MVNLPAIVPAEWPETCTQKEFAVLIGISEPGVCKHKAAGRVAMDGKRVRVRETIDRMRRHTHPGRGGDRTPAAAPRAAHSAAQAAPVAFGGSPDDPTNYQLQAAREKRASAQLREMELAERAGQLVLREARDAAEFGRARMAREAVMSIPDRLAVQLAPALPVDEVHALLTAECRRICALLAAGGQSLPTEAEAA